MWRVPATAPLHPRHPAPDQLRLDAWRAFLTAHAAVVSRIEDDIGAHPKREDLLPLVWYDLLLELVRAPEHALRQRDLAAQVVLTRSGVSRLVARLDAAKLLTRRPNPADHRGDLVVLTEAGHAAVRRTWPVYAQAIADRFARFLDKDEARVLTSALERIRGASQLGHRDVE